MVERPSAFPETQSPCPYSSGASPRVGELSREAGVRARTIAELPRVHALDPFGKAKVAVVGPILNTGQPVIVATFFVDNTPVSTITASDPTTLVSQIASRKDLEVIDENAALATLVPEFSFPITTRVERIVTHRLDPISEETVTVSGPIDCAGSLHFLITLNIHGGTSFSFAASSMSELCGQMASSEPCREFAQDVLAAVGPDFQQLALQAAAER